MKLAYRLSLQARTVIQKGNRIYIAEETGVSVLDSHSYATLFSFADFFDAEELEISPDGRYLLAVNYLYGARIYDLLHEKPLGDVRCPSGYHIYPCSYHFSLSGESIYLCYNLFENQASIFDCPTDVSGIYGYRRYALANLKEYAEINLDKTEICRIIPLMKRNRYICISKNGKLYDFYKDGLEELPDFSLDSCYREILYDNTTDLLYLEEQNGVRVYDADFHEVNRIDFAILWERESSDYVRHYDKMNAGLFPIRENSDSQLNEVRELFLFRNRYLVLYSGDAFSNISLLSVVDAQSGKILVQKKIIGTLDHVMGTDTAIVFLLNQKLYFMEVIENDGYLSGSQREDRLT